MHDFFLNGSELIRCPITSSCIFSFLLLSEATIIGYIYQRLNQKQDLCFITAGKLIILFPTPNLTTWSHMHSDHLMVLFLHMLNGFNYL